MRNAGLDEAQTGIKIAGRDINNLRYADDTTLMAESKEELKSFLMKVKEESEKAGLKLNIQKTNIMTSGPVTSWQIDGETMTDFLFFGSKITADGDCSHEIKRHLLLGRKAMTKLDSILKSRDITLLNFVCIVKTMVFPVVTYGCESWTIKKAEHWRIDAFDPWCWRRLLKDQTFYSPWNSLDLNTGVWSISLLQWIFPTQGSNPCLPHCRQILYQLSYQESPKRSNQSILKEIPEYSFEGLILKLKLQSLATRCKELTHWNRP